MGLAITNNASTINFTLDNGEKYDVDKDNMSIKKGARFVTVLAGSEDARVSQKLKFRYSEVSSPVFSSNDELYTALVGYKVNTGVTIGNVLITDETGKVMTLEDNDSLRVTIQDQVSPIVVTKFSLLEESTTTTAPIAIGDYVIPVASATGIVAGKFLSIFDPASIRFANFEVVSVASLNITVDRPSDFAFPSGSYMDVQDTDLSKSNGAVTPVVYGIRNNAGASPPPGLELSVDITRIILQCITATATDYDLFGDIAALTRGIHLRNRNGDTFNVFNAKTTGELAGLMFDLNVHDVKQGTNGFIGRLTFAGQSKMGAVQRLAIDEDLELIVQDDLTGLTKFEIIAEGSVVL